MLCRIEQTCRVTQLSEFHSRAAARRVEFFSEWQIILQREMLKIAQQSPVVRPCNFCFTLLTSPLHMLAPTLVRSASPIYSQSSFCTQNIKVGQSRSLPLTHPCGSLTGDRFSLWTYKWLLTAQGWDCAPCSRVKRWCWVSERILYTCIESPGKNTQPRSSCLIFFHTRLCIWVGASTPPLLPSWCQIGVKAVTLWSFDRPCDREHGETDIGADSWTNR